MGCMLWTLGEPGSCLLNTQCCCSGSHYCCCSALAKDCITLCYLLHCSSLLSLSWSYANSWWFIPGAVLTHDCTQCGFSFSFASIAVRVPAVPLCSYVSTVFELPADAQDKHMQLQNVTLTGLPQLPETEGSMWRQPGRLLRQLGSTVTPPGIWACLLWPWRRYGSLCDGATRRPCSGGADHQC
jgi:hypothetical protein